ncbi:hypothetical protein V2J56_00850 [Georgenia sp. MJ206]|uniref:hypothetical protein n=1 Tax=Georgenia wangjunii TaxID=3117730 RepID=UPI002F268AAC
MSEPSICVGAPPPSWDGSGAALEDVGLATRFLEEVQDALRAALPTEWVSPAAEEYSGALIDLLGRSHRLGEAIEGVGAAALLLAREVAVARARMSGDGP